MSWDSESIGRQAIAHGNFGLRILDFGFKEQDVDTLFNPQSKIRNVKSKISRGDCRIGKIRPARSPIQPTPPRI
jgi:hypothetical protein